MRRDSDRRSGAVGGEDRREKKDRETKGPRDQEIGAKRKSRFIGTKRLSIMGKVQSHNDLLIYQKSFGAAMNIFNLSKGFPREEVYSLTDQIRRSSRSVAANLGETFRKRLYPKSFIAKLIDCESEASETQIWIDFAYECGYLKKEEADRLTKLYDEIISMAVRMRLNPDQWKP